MEMITLCPKTSQDGVFERNNAISKINNRLHLAMKMRGFRQISKFAEFCGFSRPFMSAIIHKRIKPTLEQAEIISKKLNLMVQDIFEIIELRHLEIENA